LNVFREPLPESEVRAIAKSVANWVWQHMRQDSEKFIEKQRQRGKASGKARLGKANNHRVAAQALKNEGMRLSEIARTLGISQATVKKWKLE
jgi:DNA invertase Pin-like site-specific DNA recombinase